MTGELLAMLLAGLAGGFGHCIGMCGPVVAALSLGQPRQGMTHHLLYNLGRVTTYTILGALAGATGSFIALAPSLDAFQKAVMALCGLFIVILGVASAGWLPVGKRLLVCAPAMPLVRKTMALFTSESSAGAWYPLGVALGFLPCGLSYTALLAATRASMNAPDHFAGMARGALMMLFFGLGTAPALLFVGKTAGLIDQKTRHQLYRLASLVMIATGIWFIYSAIRM